MPKSVTGIIRGCGLRIPGGLYACSGLDPEGAPLKDFLIDPPIPFKGEPFRAPVIMEKKGKKHLLMFVGAEYYPFCSDFIEEVRRYGVSKRIPNNFPIEELEKGSLLFLVHPRAIARDDKYLPVVDYCPAENANHLETNDTHCLGHSYQIAPPNKGMSARRLGDTEYEVYPHSMSESAFDFEAGIFMRVPITHFDHLLKKGKADPKVTGKGTVIPINIETQ